MPYALDVESAVSQSNDYTYETYDEIMALFQRVDRTASRREVSDTWPKRDGIVISSGHQGNMKAVEIRADPKTGDLVFSYRGVAATNPFNSPEIETELTNIYKPYVYNPEAQEAQERGREAQGLAKVMKPGDEGLEVGKQYLPPGVPANIASFLTGERGSVKQQMSTLKEKSSEKGGRKSRKPKSKSKPRSTRRKTRRHK